MKYCINNFDLVTEREYIGWNKKANFETTYTEVKCWYNFLEVVYGIEQLLVVAEDQEWDQCLISILILLFESIILYFNNVILSASFVNHDKLFRLFRKWFHTQMRLLLINDSVSWLSIVPFFKVV